MNFLYPKKTYPSSPLPEIKVEYPLTIVTDTHNNLKDLRRLIKKNPNIISLGDFTSLYDKDNDFNKYSLDFFKLKKIPTLKGNHEEIVQVSDFITIEHSEYLRALPLGFKLVLPDKTHYLCFHNRPNDVWTFYPRIPTWEEFQKIYPIEKNTRGVIIGHHHLNLQYQYPDCTFTIIGRFQIELDYAILNEDGVVLNKLE